MYIEVYQRNYSSFASESDKLAIYCNNCKILRIGIEGIFKIHIFSLKHETIFSERKQSVFE